MYIGEYDRNDQYFKGNHNFEKCKNGDCLFFYFAEFDFYSAFIYENVDWPRKVNVPGGLGVCHNMLFASDTYSCTVCELTWKHSGGI